MKKIMICALIALAAITSLTASAQYGRHYRGYSNRYDNRYYHYDRYPARSSVSVIASLPFGAISLNFGNRYYHYYNGIYYRPYNRGYMIVEPPIGIIVPSLPYGCSRVIIGARPYYRYENLFYEPYGSSYRVVDEPRPSESSSADNEKTESTATESEYQKLIIDGKTYYKKGDKYYKASVNDNGEITYQEAGGIAK